MQQYASQQDFQVSLLKHKSVVEDVFKALQHLIKGRIAIKQPQTDGMPPPHITSPVFWIQFGISL